MYTFHRELPTTTQVDVLVAGGGIAGFSAAVAAARQGARTLLVEQFGVLGGQATTGGVAAFCGETRGQGEVLDRIIADLTTLNAIAPYRPYEEREARPFDHEVLAFVLQEIARAEGVELLLHTHVVDAECTGGRLGPVVLHGPSGLEAVEARCVIDATGEAILAAACGFPWVKGRESDGRQLPMSMMFFMRDTRPPAGNADTGFTTGKSVDRLQPAAGTSAQPTSAPALQPLLPGLPSYNDPSELPMTSIWPQPEGKIGVKVKVIGYDSTDTRSLTAAEIEARRTIMSVAHYLQRTHFPTHKYDYAAVRIGIREGRRVVGEYVLTEADIRAGRRFSDGIALGRFYIDAHSPDTAKRISLPGANEQVPPYHIPYRSLVPRGAYNLLVAGRCLSADQMAMSSARVMTTCAMMGQAAGIAAAQCASTGRRVLDADIAALRRELEARGAVL